MQITFSPLSSQGSFLYVSVVCSLGVEVGFPAWNGWNSWNGERLVKVRRTEKKNAKFSNKLSAPRPLPAHTVNNQKEFPSMDAALSDKNKSCGWGASNTDFTKTEMKHSIKFSLSLVSLCWSYNWTTDPREPPAPMFLWLKGWFWVSHGGNPQKSFEIAFSHCERIAFSSHSIWELLINVHWIGADHH